MQAIIHAHLILPGGTLPGGMLLLEGSRILYAGAETEIPRGAEVFDAGGLLTGPGFVDIHCHGGGYWSCGDDPERFARYHLERGTTSVLATLSYGEEPSARLERARRIRDARVPSILGIHVEGPFKNPRFGFPGKYQTPVSLAYAEALYEACGHIMLMMVSPDAAPPEELAPILRFLEARGVRLAAGHGDCTREQYALLARYGLCVATHHYCASGNYSETRGVRRVGLDELVDLDDRVWAEIIPDHAGAHVAPERIRLCNRCKGRGRVIVITDSVPLDWNADDESDPALRRPLPDPARPHSAGDCDIHWVDGALDGSELDMAKACFNMRRHSGEEASVVWRQASENPARMLGVERRVGQLIPGADADVVVADEDFNLRAVFSKGVRVR